MENLCFRHAAEKDTALILQFIKELAEYEEALNPISTFFEEMGDSLCNEPTKKCYRLYDQFCFENAMKPISHVEFSRQVKERFGYDIKTVRFEGKPTKIFVKKVDDNEHVS